MTSIMGLLVEFTAKTTGLDAAFKKTEQGMAKVDQQAKNTSKSFDNVIGSTKKFLGVTAAFSAIAGVMSAISDSTVRFSKAMGELSAITGATGKDLEFLKNSAQKFGQTTLTSAVDATNAMKLIASAKPELLSNVDALEQVTKQVITLSEASGVNMPSAVAAAVDSLNMFGKGADQAARFVDVLAAGAKYGSSEVEQTAVAIQKSGVIASQAGLSFEQLNAAIQILAENGQKAEIAGTGLRGVLLKLTTQSNQNFNPSIVGMQKAFENLSKANLTATERKKMFGEEGVTVAAILTKETAKLASMTEKIKEHGVALAQATINANTYAAKMTRLSNAWENTKIAIGDSAEIGGTAGAVTTYFNNMTESVKKYGAALGIVKGMTLDPWEQARQGAISLVTPDTGDAGATKTMQVPKGWGQQTRDAKAMLETGVDPNIARMKGYEDLKNEWIQAGKSLFEDKTVKESFIAPIISAGVHITRFAETTQEAASRLENAFSSGFGDPAKRTANDVIGNLGSKEKDKFDAAAKGIDPAFFEQTQKAAALVSQIQFSKGAERNNLTNELYKIQEDLNYQSFKNGSGEGQIGVATKSGGTFSVTGNNGVEGQEQLRVMQSIVGDLNKFIAQQLQTEQRVKVIIEIKDPSKPEWIKWMQGETEKAVNEVTKKAAQQGAK